MEGDATPTPKAKKRVSLAMKPEIIPNTKTQSSTSTAKRISGSAEAPAKKSKSTDSATADPTATTSKAKKAKGKQAKGKKKNKAKKPTGPKDIPLHVPDDTPQESLFASKRKKQKKKAKKEKEETLDPAALASDIDPAQLQVDYVDNRRGPRPGEIANKLRRKELYKSQKHQKEKDKKARRRQRDMLEKQYGDAVPKPKPKTIESMRVSDGTEIAADDEEVLGDERSDEFASYFLGKTSKVLVTLSTNRPFQRTLKFVEELINIIPSATYRKRNGFPLKTIVEQASARGYTALIVVNQNMRRAESLVMSHLPSGPTAHFKLSSVVWPKDIHGTAKDTGHFPEVLTTNFNTRLGKQVSRMFQSLFPQHPEFTGRSVVTFHCQRDFIFFRRHRYIFRDTKRVGLQEIGPQFTLKLQSLQRGTFDTKYGDYEFVAKADMYVDRKKMYL
ncbi:ribosome production factor 1 [Salpingoeca rosetta]|uniref:Ribosome production factor 1 n=1 Tax=Salpingoeca rosetta (strain ATCC 50818 / BSB-021) TaxID=946362 RepID=F2UEQ9_SALR5|nr:ribosome production factor 1 [Salpingoeca rosetta]EGD75109.1 ribosome production factor 1 [Salpingoeca rosetta]|eukprot:XP_004992162.1 ribosome production factor 1 [Salpingoeca rosetta]